jgi:outer membrane protein OmpA-like peptidoglycan-associated protein
VRPPSSSRAARRAWLVELALSFVVYLLPLLTVHVLWIVGEYLVRSAAAGGERERSWIAAEWAVVLIAQLALLVILRLTRGRPPVRWMTVPLALLALTVVLNITLLWLLPVRYLIEEDRALASNNLSETCLARDVELLPTSSSLFPAAGATHLVVRRNDDQRFASLAIHGCEVRVLDVPATASLAAASPRALLWTAAPVSGARPPAWFVNDADGTTWRIDGAAVPDKTYPQVLDDGTVAWIEGRNPVRLTVSAPQRLRSIDLSGVPAGSLGPVRGASADGPFVLSVIARGAPRWLTVDGAGRVGSGIEAPEMLAPFGHELRPIPDGWIAWDTYRENGRYTIAWMRDGRLVQRQLPRGLAFTSVAVDARGEHVAVSATSGLSIGSQRDEVWIARTADGAELFRRYAPKYSRATVAFPGAGLFAVGDTVDGRSAVRVYALPAGSQGGQADDHLAPRPAVEYVVEAFERYPLVALSEMHGNAESKDFLARLIRHPAFADRVDDIVIEFGNARYQDVVDRYIAGETIERDTLKQVWEETTQTSGIWSLPMYEEILADVRAVNLARPAGRRLRVLLGDPPIDWSQVTSPADDDMNDWRDAHFAWVVERRVRDRGRKALIFVGGAHIGRKVVFPNSLIHLLDARYPGQTHVVSVVDIGATEPALAKRLSAWSVPSAASVRGTWLGRSDVTAIGSRFSRGLVEQDVDAILYLSALPLAYRPAPPTPAAGPRAEELQRRRALAEATLPFRGGRIRFEPSTARLAASSIDALQAVRRELASDRSLRVLVKGFADGEERDADRLSTERARAATDWLVSAGIARDRLRALGCGATRPLWADSVEGERRAANRRVEIVRHTATAGCQPPASFEGM